MAISSETALPVGVLPEANHFYVYGLEFYQPLDGVPNVTIIAEFSLQSDGKDGTKTDLVKRESIQVPAEDLGGQAKLYEAVTSACYAYLQAQGVFPRA